ncbi:ABC transporter permease [Candidatus Pacearchaeota archaeon]|nr:ABC transporter permease [Candidatus Pacearchaeota archaeon]
MISKESVNYSLRNLKNRKFRSFLTIFSIFAGIVTIFIFISFGAGLYKYVDEVAGSSSADKVLVMSKGGFGGLDTSFELTEDNLKDFAGTPGIYVSTGVYFRSVEIGFNDQTIYSFLIGFDPQKPLIMEMSNIGISKGRMLSSGDGRDILLGYNYQIKDRIFSKPIDLNNNIEINGEEFRVIGFLEEVGNPQDDSQVYIADDAMKEFYGDENLPYNWIIASADTSNMDQVVKNAEKSLRKSRGLEEGKEDFFVQSFTELMEGYSTALNVIVAFIILIALISILVSSINTANTMITSVLERVKEIGIIKSIGGKNSEVFKIFLFESSFLGFVAGVFGVVVGWAVSALGGEILNQLGYGFLSPYFPLELFIGCILFAVLTGAVSGVIPAINATKINPVEALRYE